MKQEQMSSNEPARGQQLQTGEGESHQRELPRPGGSGQRSLRGYGSARHRHRGRVERKPSCGEQGGRDTTSGA